MQLRRFEDAFFEEVRALEEARERHQLNTDTSENVRAWRESYDKHYAPYDPQRPLRVPSFSLHMQVANELDLLSVAVRNVLRAQARIPEEQRPSMGGQDVLALLRNVSEHWDEVGGRSARELAHQHPDVEVGGIAYTNKEVWIGGLEGVPLSRITAWLYRMRSALVSSLAGSGFEVPKDLSTSRIEGDDDLPWPPDRLNFHWSLPTVEEEHWPREKMPPEVAEVLQHIFARRRARDYTD